MKKKLRSDPISCQKPHRLSTQNNLHLRYEWGNVFVQLPHVMAQIVITSWNNVLLPFNAFYPPLSYQPEF